MFIRSLTAGLVAVGVAALSVAPVTAATAAPTAPRSCFFVTQWQGWKAPTPDTLYLGVGMRDVYKVELSGASPMLQSPGVHLVSIHRGSSSICTALDLDLKVSDGHGFTEPLIARTLTKLTPEEVAAIPRKFRP
ncbi:MAG TPA: hypothetical protein VFE03_05695 [Caulobacteraceae bacterium]|jgi:hypothetical protein|nr:hypothetical protein [Caulobacteraceae bacterium]